MGTDPQTVYRHHADDYHRLVLAEDCDDRLLPALESLHPLSGARVLEVGVGTGRVTAGLLDSGARVDGFDKHQPMLDVARDHLANFDTNRYSLQAADARELPVGDRWADVAIAGWVFGHFRYWMPDDWRRQTATALDEMDRALVDGGVGIIIETLGTGTTEPNPPEGLLDYYDWLETERGCSHRSIRTDYEFDDVETAADTLGFFFGEHLADRVRAEGWTRVPEVTGIWSWEKNDEL